MKNLFLIFFFSLLFFNNANAGCDDAPGDGVDYSGCAFSDEQNLTGTFIPNSNLSFTGFIKVIFDKSIMMNSKLANGNFPESSFIRANLYEANLEGGNFEKTNFSSANLTRVNFKAASLIEANRDVVEAFGFHSPKRNFRVIFSKFIVLVPYFLLGFLTRLLSPRFFLGSSVTVLGATVSTT